METNLKKLKTKHDQIIKKAKSANELELLRVELLGRKGLVNKLFSKIKEISPDKRKEYGSELNQLKNNWENLLQLQKKKVHKEEQEEGEEKGFKYSLKKFGHLHPITVTTREINELFGKMGFCVYDGPETETDEYCFRRLNVPKDHPARDLQDTIYIQGPEILLRTQTSSVEVHLLENEKPPFRAVIPGRVYRNEKITKSNHFIFHQYQGVAVDKNITLKDLIGVFNTMFKHLYGPQVIVKYRCKYYPEVEPGLGLDLQCFNCHGKGCPLCKGAGWIEMGGAGIIHPKVMKVSGIDPKKWRGFAFGLGLDRWVMAKYKIKDIRTLTGGNLAYLPYQS